MDIARRVIEVTADQVIGPPRHRRNRKPKIGPIGDPLMAGNWCESPPYLHPSRGIPENAPTQQGFGHLDKIAREMKA